jgi:hypothetical protein
MLVLILLHGAQVVVVEDLVIVVRVVPAALFIRY